MKLPFKIKKSLKFLGIFAFLVVSLIAIITVGFYVRDTRIATQKSSALYGGEAEAGYFPAGYMIAYKSGVPSELCGILFFSETTGISAAHCLDGADKFTAGQGNFNTTTLGDVQIKAFAQHPLWDRKKSDNDLSVLTFEKPQTNSAPVSIVVPKEACNYRIIGYGRTELDQGTLTLDRPRKGADVCVSLVDENVVYINGSKGGICVGDSGSPIFEKDTNNVIGVISAIIVKDTKDPCYIGNTAIVIRLDKKTDYIASRSGSTITSLANQGQDNQQFAGVRFEAGNIQESVRNFVVTYTSEIELGLLIAGIVIVIILIVVIFIQK